MLAWLLYIPQLLPPPPQPSPPRASGALQFKIPGAGSCLVQAAPRNGRLHCISNHGTNAIVSSWLFVEFYFG
jgi:hypothetical protein